MKIVASTKLARAQRAMTDSRTYGQTSQQVFDEAKTKPLDEKKTLLVIASSDKGLCGGIHSGMTRATRRMLETDSTGYDLVIIGEKCKAQLGRSNPKSMVLSFAGIGRDIPTFADAQAVADQIAQLPTEYASIKIMYNKFVNAQSFEPVIVEAFSEEAIAASANFSAFEIDPEVLANLREYALTNSLYWALAEGHACEQSARRNAMDVCNPFIAFPFHIFQTHNPSLLLALLTTLPAECFQERRRHDQPLPDPVQPNPTGRHHGRTGGNHHGRYCVCGYVDSIRKARGNPSTAQFKPLLHLSAVDFDIDNTQHDPT